MKIIILTSVILLFGFNCLLAQFSGGSGTSGDPYMISNTTDLGLLSGLQATWNCYFIQTADIDASSTITWNGGEGFKPIANSTTRFTGSYDGDGHTIDGLYISRSSDYCGFFGFTNGANIIDLGLTNVNISAGGYTGGLVGDNNGTITNCYSTGSVNVTGDRVGGLIGDNIGGTVSNCYSTCSVNGTGNVGGLVGYHFSGTVSNCYSTGSVNGSGTVGGLVGVNLYGTVSNSFWDKQTSGQPTSSGGTGKTTTEMKTLSTFTSAGWDFYGPGTEGIWNIGNGRNNGYPYFRWWYPSDPPIPFPGGSGTSGDPWQISNTSGLCYLSTRSSCWDDYFIQTADIDAPAGSFSPIGNLTIKFTGSYDGDGHTIDGLYISSSSDYCGLFGYTNGSNIIDLGVINVSISANNYVGGLVGDNNGTITNCYSTGSVNVTGDRVGGLIGDNNGGTVSNCYSTCSVNGNSRVGGLVAYNYTGTVSNCYSTGSVTGTGDVGGLVGFNNGGTVSNSFWDTETSGQTGAGGGGEGKTTAQMKTQFTFTSAGWDFDVDGISAGHNGVWIMAGYPHLQIEWTTTISDVIGLQMVWLDLDEDYTLSCNIDASATSTWNYRGGSTYDGFSPIGNSTTKFSGSYDGDGHTIDRLFISKPPGHCGLFGFANGANIIDLSLTDVNIFGYHHVGGLVGETGSDCEITKLLQHR